MISKRREPAFILSSVSGEMLRAGEVIWDSWRKATGTFKFLFGTCHMAGTLLIYGATEISKLFPSAT